MLSTLQFAGRTDRQISIVPWQPFVEDRLNPCQRSTIVPDLVPKGAHFASDGSDLGAQFRA